MRKSFVKRTVVLFMPVTLTLGSVWFGHGDRVHAEDDPTTTTSSTIPKCVDVTVDVTQPPPYVHFCPIP